MTHYVAVNDQPLEREKAVSLQALPQMTRAKYLKDLKRRFSKGMSEGSTVLKLTEADRGHPASEREGRCQWGNEFRDKPRIRRRHEILSYHRCGPANEERMAEPLPGSVFSPHLLAFALERASGPYATLSLTSALAVAGRWREALLSVSDDLPPRAREVLSGHAATGAPLEGPHAAFIPLAFVGHPHADGHLLGFALALPRELDGETRRGVLRAVGRVDRLRLGELGVWRLVRAAVTNQPWNLRSEAWTAYPWGATHWATVTPVAFDRHPKSKDQREAYREQADMIAAACGAVGLPRPRTVVLTHVSAYPGVPTALEFPRLRRKDGSERRHAHAILVFNQRVIGPVFIGAGRYRGYGACRAMDAEVRL